MDIPDQVDFSKLAGIPPAQIPAACGLEAVKFLAKQLEEPYLERNVNKINGL